MKQYTKHYENTNPDVNTNIGFVKKDNRKTSSACADVFFTTPSGDNTGTLFKHSHNYTVKVDQKKIAHMTDAEFENYLIKVREEVNQKLNELYGEQLSPLPITENVNHDN